jgi:hypothetical protein
MDAVEQAVLVVAGTGALLLFAAYARRDEPDRYRRAVPLDRWLAAGPRGRLTRTPRSGYQGQIRRPSLVDFPASVSLTRLREPALGDVETIHG